MLGFIIDEKVSIVHCFGQRAMRLPKLRKMEPCGGQDKLGMPDLLVFVGVIGIKIRALTCASLRVGKEPNGSGPCFLGSPWQQLLHEGGHSDNCSVFPGGIVHLVPTKSKESSEERNTLRP